MSKDLPTWTIDSSEYIVDDKFLKLRLDSCTTPAGGKVGTYYVMEYDDWVTCVAIDTDGNVTMLKNYRHAARKYFSEFIGGGIEATDASPEVAARRELEEEAGYTGGKLYHVGTGYANPATHTNKVHAFLAIGGKIDREQNLEVGESIIIEKIPFQALLEQMRAPEAEYPCIFIATMFYTINFIQRSSDPGLQPFKQYL